jgi:hypothetical protein
LKDEFSAVDFKSNFQFKLEFARANLGMVDPYQGAFTSREQGKQAFVEQD